MWGSFPALGFIETNLTLPSRDMLHRVAHIKYVPQEGDKYMGGLPRLVKRMLTQKGWVLFVSACIVAAVLGARSARAQCGANCQTEVGYGLQTDCECISYCDAPGPYCLKWTCSGIACTTCGSGHAVYCTTIGCAFNLCTSTCP
jgi:hypothetical protein